MLHLVGNVEFLAALFAGFALVRSRGGWQPDDPWLRGVIAVQTMHVIEHLALAGSTVWVGRPIGVTTAFGLLSPGVGATAVRVVAHFAVNAVATGLLAVVVARVVLPLVAAPARPGVARCVECGPDLVVRQRVGGVAVVGADREDRADHGAVGVDDG